MPHVLSLSKPNYRSIQFWRTTGARVIADFSDSALQYEEKLAAVGYYFDAVSLINGP
jgi:hypothetical protein